jgi:hypothetical protein
MTTKEEKNAARRAARAAKKNSSISPEMREKMDIAGNGALEVIARHAKPAVEAVVSQVKTELPNASVVDQIGRAAEIVAEKKFKYARLSMPELVAAVRAYAVAHEKRGGWRYTVASTDEELITIIDKATSVNGAIINARNAQPRS